MIQTQINGVVCEYLAAAWFVNLGCVVSWPLDNNAEYDFIIETEGETPQRVQVKKVYFDNNKNRYIGSLVTPHKRGNGSVIYKKYNEDSFDLCAFVCTEYNVIYVVPIEFVFKRRSVTFYPDRKEPNITTQRTISFEQFKHELINHNGKPINNR